MLDSLTTNVLTLLQEPMVEITFLDRFKDFVNRIGVPQYSLPIFVIVSWPSIR